MASTDIPQDAAPLKRSKLPVILGLVLALVLGGGGFYATFTGLILSPAGHGSEGGAVGSLPDIAFVPVPPVVVSLGPGAGSRHLRFAAQLETAGAHQGDVTLLLPRILDVMNGYLRAVAVAELDNPAALVRIRAHLLRRIQIVTGEGRVRDLLITEFVLN